MNLVMCNEPHAYHGECGDPEAGSVLHLNVTLDMMKITVTDGLMNDNPPSEGYTVHKTSSCVYVFDTIDYTYNEKS